MSSRMKDMEFAAKLEDAASVECMETFTVALCIIDRFLRRFRKCD